MSRTVKAFIQEAYLKASIDEFLEKELSRAGYAGVEIIKTPMGDRVIIKAARLGLVIGRRGRNIKYLEEVLKSKFGLENPQIDVVEVEKPELCARIVAQRIARAIERGMHFRRVAYSALRRIMEAGAIGAEIIIKGKLAGDRAKRKVFRAGIMKKCGEDKERFLDEAVAVAYTKPGCIGVKVRIMRPDLVESDRIVIDHKKAMELVEKIRKQKEEEVKKVGDIETGRDKENEQGGKSEEAKGAEA